MTLCTATTAKGQPCKNTTVKNFPACWIHLKQQAGLQVKKSEIPGAGDGLFFMGKKDKKPFPAKKKITNYSGKTITTSENPDSDYVLKIGKNRYLDSAPKDTHPGRYINDPRGTNKRANVRFSTGQQIYDVDGRKAIPIISTRKIKPNTELLTRYGKSYW